MAEHTARFVTARLRRQPVAYSVEISHFTANGEWRMSVAVKDVTEDDVNRRRVADDLRIAAEWLDPPETLEDDTMAHKDKDKDRTPPGLEKHGGKPPGLARKDKVPPGHDPDRVPPGHDPERPPYDDGDDAADDEDAVPTPAPAPEPVPEDPAPDPRAGA